MEVGDSALGFKIAVRLFAGWFDMTLGTKVGTPGVNRELLENSAVGMKLIRKPSQVGLPTSVGFATSAHAKCAFLVLQKVFAGLTAVEPGGHPADGHVAVNLSESTLMGQFVSNDIFHRLTLTIASVR